MRQGEILSDIPEIVVNPGTSDIARVERPFGIVVTPDCDLERHWELAQHQSRPGLRNVHFLMGAVATDRTLFPKAVWGKIRKADHVATHAVEECPTEFDHMGEGLPPLVFDFQNPFSVPISLVYGGLEESRIKRRSQLLSPYRDNLIQRFISYVGRVALEENHNLPD